MVHYTTGVDILSTFVLAHGMAILTFALISNLGKGDGTWEAAAIPRIVEKRDLDRYSSACYSSTYYDLGASILTVLTSLRPDPHPALFKELLSGLGEGIDPTGLELVRLVHMVVNLYASEAENQVNGVSMSGPRWRLLLRLFMEERRGRADGLAPSYLSRCQNVSKNTISVLLRGLEEHGWVERTLDPEDHRVFRIRLTPAGRDLIRTSAPERLAHLNALVDDLSAEERTQLIRLLSKLHRSLADRAGARSPADLAQP
jgi:DNA-binding MarR family transcriptional regulator